METVNIEDFKKEQKRRERKEKWAKRVKRTVEFVNDNKEVITVCVSGAIFAYRIVGKASNTYVRNKRINEERRHRDLEIYDHSTGMYLQLKRPMKADEVVYFTKRCKEGLEPKAMILRDMNLLK